MSYQDTLRKHRRLTILRYLANCASYTSNASILSDVVNDFGISSTRDQITTELAWLAENGFVTNRGEGMLVASATHQGVEIAEGRALHPDIQRPRPGQSAAF